MDRVTTLADVVQREVELYNVGKAFGAATFTLNDPLQQTYAVVAIPHNFKERPAWVVVMARVVGDYIVIDEDTTNKPLVEALMHNGGIPRERIILAYAGETLPEQTTA